MSVVLRRIPLLHVIEHLTFSVVLQAPFDLVRLARLVAKQQSAFTAMKQVFARLVEVVIRRDKAVIAKSRYAGDIDNSGNAVFADRCQDRRSITILPCLADTIGQKCHYLPLLFQIW